MKLWLDTANIEEIREINAWGVLSGITTNPTLAGKESLPFEQMLKEVLGDSFSKLTQRPRWTVRSAAKSWPPTARGWSKKA